MPITGKDEDMPKWGWIKAVTWEQVWHKDGIPMLTETWFDIEAMQCLNCKSNLTLWLWIPPHNYSGGVFMGCSQCRKVYGPLATEEYGVNQTTKQITIQEAVAICNRTKQSLPSGLRKAADKLRIQRRLARRNAPPRVGDKKINKEALEKALEKVGSKKKD